MTGGGTGVDFLNPNGGTIFDIQFSNCMVSNFTGDGIYCDPVGTGGAGSAISFNGCYIANNSANGMHFLGGAQYTLAGSNIRNNNQGNVGGSQLALGNGAVVLSGMAISGNFISGTPASPGITVAGRSVNQLAISRNVFAGNTAGADISVRETSVLIVKSAATPPTSRKALPRQRRLPIRPSAA